MILKVSYSTLLYILYSIVISIQLQFELFNTILYYYYKFLKCIIYIMSYFDLDYKLQKQYIKNTMILQSVMLFMIYNYKQ